MSLDERPAELRHVHSPAEYMALARAVETGPGMLRVLAERPYTFLQLAVAAHPNTPTDLLTRLAGLDVPSNDVTYLLTVIARHPRADRAALLVILGRVRADLAGHERRPYPAALALATRAELTTAELIGLMNLPGASRRFRGGLRAQLAARDDA